MPLQVQWGPAVPGWEGDSLGLPIPSSGSTQEQTQNPGDPRKDAREKACFVPPRPPTMALRLGETLRNLSRKQLTKKEGNVASLWLITCRMWEVHCGKWQTWIIFADSQLEPSRSIFLSGPGQRQGTEVGGGLWWQREHHQSLRLLALSPGLCLIVSVEVMRQSVKRMIDSEDTVWIEYYYSWSFACACAAFTLLFLGGLFLLLFSLPRMPQNPWESCMDAEPEH